MEVRIELAYDRPQEIIRLFTEYTDSIIAKDTEVAKCLNSQHYDDEVKELNEKYGLPNGRLYLAYLNRDIVGCVALRQLDVRFCEMKRLYVRPGYRGKHIGNALIEQMIADARQIGYKHMRLDTLYSSFHAAGFVNNVRKKSVDILILISYTVTNQSEKLLSRSK
ncbi:MULTISPECIES: GNAT family N-acetyltransferase [Clostridia]|uniref:GNAT family N-acetyltransferase n=1 Tax=Clostridia TaxID=186801 RepID=UPI0012B259A6